ncbi:MAG: lipoyl(octanoyl) transferase LipB [Alphaproteobacteria bacterium]|nr:lipoyl(octanoyl) transferase LipB [Alphaproteobacteria bacterium]
MPANEVAWEYQIDNKGSSTVLAKGDNAMEWRIDDAAVSYPEAVALMEARVLAIREGRADEMVWLALHPPLYTAGTSARPEDLLDPDRFPVFQSGRGGQYTYHGPGQRVAYVMLDLKARGGDVRRFVHDLEDWVIRALARFAVKGERREGRVGIWVARGGGREDKIAAIGVRVRRWVSYHGIAINVDPDLSHFDGIVPCGIRAHGVTSLWDLGHTPTMAEVDSALIGAFDEVFGEDQASPRTATP